jgi:nucleoside-diphosphate-sugar epimerase
MRVLVLGASGATGSLVVRQLIRRKITTRILIRKSAVLPKEIIESQLIETVKGNINELDYSEMNHLVQNCNVVISCLGHNLSFKGMFGHPRYLVRDAIRSVCETVKKTANEKVKLILMSTTAFTNILSGEKSSIGERLIFSLLMFLLPPHRDNVKVANLLIHEIGKQNEKIEWVAIRPDTLIDNDVESSYEICKSPKRSPIFNAGETSRINVSHFMAELVTDEGLWKKWLFKTPVIYNE